MKRVTIEMKVSAKGKVVISSVFRREYIILPEEDILFKDTSEGLLLQKQKKNYAEIYKQLSERAKTIKKKRYTYEEQIEERTRRAGIKL